MSVRALGRWAGVLVHEHTLWPLWACSRPPPAAEADPPPLRGGGLPFYRSPSAVRLARSHARRNATKRFLTGVVTSVAMATSREPAASDASTTSGGPAAAAKAADADRPSAGTEGDKDHSTQPMTTCPPQAPAEQSENPTALGSNANAAAVEAAIIEPHPPPKHLQQKINRRWGPPHAPGAASCGAICAWATPRMAFRTAAPVRCGRPSIS